MGVADTSRRAYEKVRPTLGPKQEIVFGVIKRLQPVDNETIAEVLDWPINRVTGRVNELEGYDYVTCECKGPNRRGMLVKKWATKERYDRQMDLLMDEVVEENRHKHNNGQDYAKGEPEADIVRGRLVEW